jgi:hypothetical protein
MREMTHFRLISFRKDKICLMLISLNLFNKTNVRTSAKDFNLYFTDLIISKEEEKHVFSFEQFN